MTLCCQTIIKGIVNSRVILRNKFLTLELATVVSRAERKWLVLRWGTIQKLCFSFFLFSFGNWKIDS